MIKHSGSLSFGPLGIPFVCIIHLKAAVSHPQAVDALTITNLLNAQNYHQTFTAASHHNLFYMKHKHQLYDISHKKIL